MARRQAPVAVRTAAAAESRRRYPERSQARNKVARAIRSGVLVRPTACARCGVACRPEASHDDYSKPLEVEWLCRSCHVAKDAADRRQPWEHGTYGGYVRGGCRQECCRAWLRDRDRKQRQRRAA